jgi:hypothetical protein
MEAKATPEEFAGHLRLTAIKYLSRAGYKRIPTLMDLKKAQWYVNEVSNVCLRSRLFWVVGLNNVGISACVNIRSYGRLRT